MLSFLLTMVSLLDRISQTSYRRAVAFVLRRLGVQIEGLPLWISPRTYIDAPRSGALRIGDRAVISHYVRILTHDFSIDRAAERKYGLSDQELSRRAEVRIGAQAFIGMGAILMPGVTVGDGAIVGAGSVVTKDVPDDTVVAGNPARVITTTADYLSRREASHTWHPRRR